MVISGSTRPLPPPVPVTVNESQVSDPFSLGAIFQRSPQPEESSVSASSSVSEPAPGEPLPAESERVLEELSSETGGEGDEAEFVSAGASGGVASFIPSINFKPELVKKYLNALFTRLADGFDSAHWLLTEDEADLLAGPTAELLGGAWSKLSQYLPEMLVSFPGATAFIFAAGVVIGPKIAQQMAISKVKKRGLPVKPRSEEGPQPVPPRPKPEPTSAPVGTIKGAQV